MIVYRLGGSVSLSRKITSTGATLPRPPSADEHAIRVSIAAPIDEIVERAAALLRPAGGG